MRNNIDVPSILLTPKTRVSPSSLSKMERGGQAGRDLSSRKDYV